MKFLIVSQTAGSPEHGMVIRNYNWGKSLVDLGHEVTIVASSHSHSRSFNPDMQGQVIKKEDIDGIEYIWLLGPDYSGKSILKRLYAMYVFNTRLKKPDAFLNKKYDVVICSSPPPFYVSPCVKLSQKMGAKFIYDIRDLWPLSAIHLGGYSPKNPLIKLMAKQQRLALKHADIVTAVPNNCEKYLMSEGLKEDKFMPIGNGVLGAGETELTDTSEIEQHLHVLTALRQKHRFVLTYTGAIGMANALDSLVEAMARTPKYVSCVIVGNGPEKENLEKLIATYNLSSRVKILEPIPSCYIPTFLSKIDACYCGLKDKVLFKYGVSPTKLNDITLAKKPMIYAVSNPQNIVEQSSCGLAAPAEDVDAIAKAITSMANMSSEQHKEMGEKGYNWTMKNSIVSEQMYLLLRKLKQLGTF